MELGQDAHTLGLCFPPSGGSQQELRLSQSHRQGLKFPLEVCLLARHHTFRRSTLWLFPTGNVLNSCHANKRSHRAPELRLPCQVMKGLLETQFRVLLTGVS